MTKINKLINQYCPDGVSYKALKEISEYSKVRVDASEIDDYTYVGVDNLLPNKRGKTKSSYVPKEGRLIHFSSKDILIGNIRPYLKKIWLAAHDGATNGDVLTIHLTTDKVDAEYLYYCLSSDQFFLYDMNHAKGAKMPRGDKEAVMEYEVPVPPLEVQREIVHILDSFTFYISELSAELSARREQYSFYKEQMLMFDDNVRYEKLKDLVTFRNGKGHEKSITENGKYIVVNSKFISTNGDVRKYSEEQLCPLYENDILMVMSDLPNGRALAKCYIVDENDKYTLNQRIGAFTNNDTNKIITRFLLYVLNRNKQLLKYDNGVDQTNLRKEDILNISVPIPSKEVQERIVYFLDMYESICSDITIGLPGEIEARQKQYEYYRDKLLDFKKIN